MITEYIANFITLEFVTFAILGNVLKNIKKQVDLENGKNENHISDEFANSVYSNN